MFVNVCEEITWAALCGVRDLASITGTDGLQLSAGPLEHGSFGLSHQNTVFT